MKLTRRDFIKTNAIAATTSLLFRRITRTPDVCRVSCGISFNLLRITCPCLDMSTSSLSGWSSTRATVTFPVFSVTRNVNTPCPARFWRG